MRATNLWSARVFRKLLQSRQLWKVACIMLGLLLSIGHTLQAYAAPGDLDTNFGTGGLVTTDFTGPLELANAIAIQSDGKIVAAGMAEPSGTADFAIARYNTNGTLDDNFAANGKVTTDFFGGHDDANAVAIQSDGKIVAGGYAYNSSTSEFAVARYNPDGGLDTSFSGNGKVVVDFGASSVLYGLAIQSDGKIVAAGVIHQTSNWDFALARFNANGSLDTTFSGDGKVTTDLGSIYDTAGGVAIQPDGKIVAAGSSSAGTTGDFALARYNANGSLDTSFSFDGMVTTDFVGENDYAEAIVLQSDGKIVAAGTATVAATGPDVGIARYTSDGTLDNSFGGNGKVTTDFGDREIANAIAIQSDGKIVAAGTKTIAIDDSNFILARYNLNGSLDTTFSGNGKVTTDFSGYSDKAYGVAIQANGKIVAAGETDTGTTDHFALARYEGDPPPTPTATPILTIIPTDTPAPPSPTAGQATSTPVEPTPCTIEFSDVPSNSTFYPYIRCLACRGILGGYPDGTFQPGNNVTRGQLSKIVANAAGFNETHTEQSFEDVVVGSTFHIFVERMASRGIIGGYQCGGQGEPCGVDNLPYFRPSANATRGQISKIVSNAAGYVDDPGPQIFEDVMPGSSFYDFVQRLANRGIMGGYDCGGVGEPCGPANLPYFRPASNATRGQTAKIVSNTFFPNCQVP